MENLFSAQIKTFLNSQYKYNCPSWISIYIYLVLNYSEMVNNSSEVSLATIKRFCLLNRLQERWKFL